jgi:TolA-binding protein
MPSACCSRDTQVTTRLRHGLLDRRVCLLQAALLFHKPHAVAAKAVQGLAAVTLTSVGDDANRSDRRQAQGEQRTKQAQERTGQAQERIGQAQERIDQLAQRRRELDGMT